MKPIPRFMVVSLAFLFLVEHSDALDQWTWRNPLPTRNNLSGIVYGNGSFVAVGALGTILTSPDGVSWASRNSGTGSNLECVAYGNGQFVVGSAAETTLTSVDGTNWVEHRPGPLSHVSAIAYGNGGFVVDGWILTVGFAIKTAQNGASSWMNRYAEPYYQLGGIAYGNSRFVILSVRSNMVVSSDAWTWTRYDSGHWDVPSGIAFG